MRKLIIDKLNYIKAREHGIDRRATRWHNLKFISIRWCDVEFNNLTDEELLEFYERTVRRCTVQM